MFCWLSFVENVSAVISGHPSARSSCRRRRLRRKSVRYDGPLCGPPVDCADDDAGAGEGRLRKLSPPGTRKPLDLVWPMFAIL